MKFKFSLRNEFKVTAGLLAVMVLVGFADRNLRHNTCKDIVVTLENVRENHFLDEADVLRMVETIPGEVRTKQFSVIDFREIEERLKSYRNFRDVQLFNDLKGNLVVNVSLRRPVARLAQESGPDAYLSEEGLVIPVSDRYSSRVVILSGSMVKQIILDQDLNKSDYGKRIKATLDFINGDSFLKKQIAEIELNSDGTINLLPQIGSQTIEFGKPEKLEDKFLKLKVFYKSILPERGWNKYHRVNLEFENQVIAE
ncbi:MAG: cell division protein FtsQ/DivIB [Cyclobacteriaceae bacterium]